MKTKNNIMKSVVVTVVAKPRKVIVGEGVLTRKGTGKIFKN